MLGIIGLYSNYELILSILESQAQTSGIGPDSQEFTAQVYFSCGLGPAAPALLYYDLLRLARKV